MKYFLIMIFSLSLYADAKHEMLSFYQNKKYEQVCNMGLKNLTTYSNDEEYLLLYGFSCLKSDNIDRLNAPVAMLKSSKEARSNAAYFSVILMQKKLLLHSLVDGYNLSKLKLPTTNYVLSKVFDLYSKIGEHERRDFYLFEDTKNNKFTYKLYLEHHQNQIALVLEEYYDGVIIKKHTYW